MEDLNEIVQIGQKEIEDLIYTIRGQKVMLDSDLAKIYGYETKRLNEQVRRNLTKFQLILCLNYQMMKFKICGRKMRPQT